ncbi:hypothetical protein SAMN05444920_101959 [Nonomuraea solani]|uniref:Uncharacterized protein n=1 Tax=Nonomuraea solani TaxID=1144553 RepID=A0A1H5VR58_9ACTN|nr:hypothetical protein [Nonomuraea solani]SEF89714.1 hypothetical protein SAMN05444920_101959 [Nonomuraea solani]
MTYRARWRGADYPASPEPHAMELWVRLRSAEPLDGFEEVEPGCHVRTVPAPECESLHLVTTVCRWRGEPFLVCAEEEGRLLIEYPGGSAIAARELGLERVERGVYRLWVPRSEVSGLQEEVVAIDVQNQHIYD